MSHKRLAVAANGRATCAVAVGGTPTARTSVAVEDAIGSLGGPAPARIHHRPIPTTYQDGYLLCIR